MKLRNKIFLGLFCALLISQIPFFINRWRTANLSTKITNLAQQKTPDTKSGYQDYKGVVHVHSFLGGHSTGTFDKLLASAEKTGLDFVVMTEHVSEFYDTSAMTLRDKHKGILFIGGNETSVKDGNRFLVVDGFRTVSAANKLATNEFIEKVHSEERLALVTYPEKFKSWDADIDGIEVFSLHTNAKKMNPVTLLFDAIWSYRAYSELTLARYFKRPDSNLAKFDELTRNKKLTLFAGTDAHSNLGFHVGDDSNNKWLNIKFDRYETIFGLVRTHILVKDDLALNKETAMDALKNGRAYIGFDVLSDSTGFSFTASNNEGTKTMGDEILLSEGEIDIEAQAPQVSRFLVFQNGKRVFESGQTTKINFKPKEAGAYRIEVYLDTLGSPFDKMPWIISNPIYVR